jgi:copper transport protein
MWLLRVGAYVAALSLLAALPARPSRRALMAVCLPVAVAVATLPLGGHADTQSPRAVLVPADLVHAVAAGAWLGGLVALLAVFWPRGRGAAAPAAGAREATARFSALALPAMAALVAAGAVQAWFYLGSPGALLQSTYGLALTAKVVLLAAILAFAARSRRRVRALAAETGAGLRRAMLAEVALALLVIAATATLVRAAPPAAAGSGPVVRELDAGPMRVELVVEPARVGVNAWHVYLFDRRSGAQVDRVEQVTVRLTEPERGIGPITLDLPRKGPAHYELLRGVLGVAGRWEAELAVRVSEFDEYVARTGFEVR